MRRLDVGYLALEELAILRWPSCLINMFSVHAKHVACVAAAHFVLHCYFGSLTGGRLSVCVLGAVLHSPDRYLGLVGLPGVFFAAFSEFSSQLGSSASQPCASFSTVQWRVLERRFAALSRR